MTRANFVLVLSGFCFFVWGSHAKDSNHAKGARANAKQESRPRANLPTSEQVISDLENCGSLDTSKLTVYDMSLSVQPKPSVTIIFAKDGRLFCKASINNEDQGFNNAIIAMLLDARMSTAPVRIEIGRAGATRDHITGAHPVYRFDKMPKCTSEDIAKTQVIGLSVSLEPKPTATFVFIKKEGKLKEGKFCTAPMQLDKQTSIKNAIVAMLLNAKIVVAPVKVKLGKAGAEKGHITDVYPVFSFR